MPTTEITDLMEVMPPPNEPIAAAGDWTSAEKDLGTALPDDYKVFIERYGSGLSAEFINVLNPFDKRDTMNLKKRGDEQYHHPLDQDGVNLGELKANGFSAFPEAGGLLPFAITDNGDVISWKTEGEPNQWTVVVQGARTYKFDAFGIGMVGFLLEVLSEPGVCSVFPDDFPPDEVTFESFPLDSSR